MSARSVSRQIAAALALLLCLSSASEAQDDGSDQRGCAECAVDDRPVLSLIATSDAAPHKVIHQLCETARLQKVRIGEVMLLGYKAQKRAEMAEMRRKIGIPEDFDPTLPKKELLRELRSGAHRARGDYRPGNSIQAFKLNLESSGSAPAEAVLRHFGIARLPAWIVRYHGRDYVFQGGFSPSRLFTGDGNFREDDGQPPIKSKGRDYLSDLKRPVVNRDFGEPPYPLLKLAGEARETIFSTQCSASK